MDGERAFLEWWATFDCDTGRREELGETLVGWFATWLESLRATLAGGGAELAAKAASPAEGQFAPAFGPISADCP